MLPMSHRTLTALPVYNEERHIGPVLREVSRFASDILVVDDGSSDATAERLAEFPEIHVIRHDTNAGYGAALRTSFQFAVREEYDVLVTIDCDGQHEPRLIPELAAAIYGGRSTRSTGPGAAAGDTARRQTATASGTPRPATTGSNDPDAAIAQAAAPAPQFDMVSGSRYLKDFPGASRPPEERRRINQEVTATLNERLGLNLTDAFCGFKSYRVKALPGLEITELGYAMPLQLWVQAVSLGWRITEFPVPLVYLEEERSFGGSLDDSRRRMAYYTEVLERELAAHSPRRPGDLT